MSDIGQLVQTSNNHLVSYNTSMNPCIYGYIIVYNIQGSSNCTLYGVVSYMEVMKTRDLFQQTLLIKYVIISHSQFRQVLITKSSKSANNLNYDDID